MHKLLLALLVLAAPFAAAQQPDAPACAATAPLLMPPTGCRFGSAVAAVSPVDGAAYSWSVDGATIASGHGTDRIVLSLGGGDSVVVSAVISTPGCTTTATGILTLQDAFSIETFSAGSGNVGEPRTLTWSYANGSPATQVLTGTDFAGPVSLPPSARSYTYTPLSGGEKEVTLVASLAPVGRSRAVGHGGGNASSCNVARVVAKYQLGCARPDATITGPGQVLPGQPFTLSVALAPGATASWTVTNGTPATADGAQVTIVPNNNDPVDVRVTITALGGCTASATARISVNATLTCDNPTVSLGVLRNDCGGAVLQARFTGKPPFRGTWENGQPFVTGDLAFNRDITASGSYAVATFQDAICTGKGTASVPVTIKAPRVALSFSNGNCAGTATVTATFTGTPPFSGTWSDGTTFSTMSSTITKKPAAGGPLWLTFNDANCSGKTSETIDVQPGGTASLGWSGPAPSCLNSSGIQVAVTIAGGTPPFRVTWWDGAVTESDKSPVLRTVYPSLTNGVFAITAVRDASCTLALGQSIISAPFVPTPYFSPASGTTCPDTDITASTSVPLAGATISWHVTNGTILSGQGTQTIKVHTGTTGAVYITAELTASNGCTSVNTATLSIPDSGMKTPPTISVTPTTIAVGGTATMTVTFDPLATNRMVYGSYSTPGGLTWNGTCPTGATTCTYKLTGNVVGTYNLGAQESGTCGTLSAVTQLFVTK